jgi:hypothetical protein
VGEGNTPGAEADGGDEEPGDLDNFNHRRVRMEGYSEGRPTVKPRLPPPTNVQVMV